MLPQGRAHDSLDLSLTVAVPLSPRAAFSFGRLGWLQAKVQADREAMQGPCLVANPAHR